MINQLLGTLYHSSLADKELAKAKSLYRDAVWRLRETLKDYGIDIIDFARGVLKLKTLDFECDYYKFIEGDKKVYKKEFYSLLLMGIDIQEEIDRFYRSI